MASFAWTVGLLIISHICLAWTDAFNLTSTGSTLELNGIPYFIPGRPFASLPYFNSQPLLAVEGLLGGLVPVTVIETASDSLNVQDVRKTIQGFGQRDDVWGEGFLSSK